MNNLTFITFKSFMSVLFHTNYFIFIYFIYLLYIQITLQLLSQNKFRMNYILQDSHEPGRFSKRKLSKQTQKNWEILDSVFQSQKTEYFLFIKWPMTSVRKRQYVMFNYVVYTDSKIIFSQKVTHVALCLSDLGDCTEREKFVVQILLWSLEYVVLKFRALHSPSFRFSSKLKYLNH